MLDRVVLATALAVLSVFAGTEAAFAASDQDRVMVGTAIVVLGLMAFLLLVFSIKWYFGGVKLPPPEPDAADNAHH
jgi:hypothetical protein